eukprot:9465-Heterococcus_DN1.PRE.1
MGDALDDALNEDGDAEAEDAIVGQVLDEIGITFGDGVPEAPVGVSATETASGAGSQKQAVAAPAGGPAERDAPDSPDRTSPLCAPAILSPAAALRTDDDSSYTDVDISYTLQLRVSAGGGGGGGGGAAAGGDSQMSELEARLNNLRRGYKRAWVSHVVCMCTAVSRDVEVSAASEASGLCAVLQSSAAIETRCTLPQAICTVLRKEDQSHYVIKTIRIGELTYNEQMEAINEVTILARMDSPHIVQYFDSFVEDDTLHIVMEFCNRGDLSGLLKQYSANSMRCNCEQFATLAASTKA